MLSGLNQDSSVIKVDNLSKNYGKIKAVDKVSFSVDKGEVFGVIGPDGAGKTSVIQILAGVLKPDSGKAYINNIDVTKNPKSTKSIIGYMPQGLGLNLYDSLSIEENIEFFKGLRLIPDEVFEKNKKTLLDITRLSPFLQRQARALSGGMRQKLALVCTLLHLPDIILLDEPTTGVDPLSRQDFWNIIHSLVRERKVTVLLTTSYMDEAERCHRVALMHEGSILLQGRPEELGNLEEVFIKKITGQKEPVSQSFFKLNEKSEDKTIITCESVTRTFGKFKAVDSVNLSVKKGEVLGLLGPNGAGKTTLIKIICGLLEPTEGKISIAGFDIKRDRRKVWSHIGYMSQKFSLYRDLTVIENIKLYSGLYGVKNHNYSETIDFLGLKGLENRMTRDLPLGIRQRVSLACALLHEPPVLFLDEPTSGVDPLARRSFWRIIYTLSRQKDVTVIVSTHYMDEAENCDRLALMHRGRLIAEGTPEEIKKGSEKLSGSLIQIKSTDFNKVYDIVIKEFPNISLYGSKIFLRSFEPNQTLRELDKILRESKIQNYELSQMPVPLQEAFVDYIRESEGKHV
jgi:ABC-2 type transport system ATP-binding protein